MLYPMTEQPPEGRLIEAAMRQQGLSARKAALLVNLSDARLRQIINGYASAGRGHRVPVVAPAATLARIGQVLGISPQDFEEAGREDVRAFMSDRLMEGDRMWSSDNAVEELQTWLTAFTTVEGGATLDGEHPPQDALSLWSDVQILQEVADRLAFREMETTYLSEGRFDVGSTRAVVAFTSDQRAQAWITESELRIEERAKNAKARHEREKDR